VRVADGFALTLALIALAISIWIVVPGPTLPLFALSVGGTELWPVPMVFASVALTLALRIGSWLRPIAIVAACAALLCSLAPPVAYLVRGPYVPLAAFLNPIPPPAPRAALPANAPIVVAIHGGAWERGSVRNDAALNATIASWGYHVIALDYPPAPQSRWPAQRTSVLRQIDALPSVRIAVVGHSSGAQLAMIAAALRPHRISALITYESPVDLRLGYEHPSHPDIINVRQILSDLCGGTPEQRPACYHDGSPRYVVHSGMPPVLMIAAGRDHVVDLGFEHLLRDELRADGVNVTYLELPWADHAFEDVPVGFHSRIALWYVKQFLNDHVPPEPVSRTYSK
jgi:acetyl esterase/lipase